MFIELVEGTANIDYILTTIQRKWGNEYRLVTSDGIELEDSPATQGISFWKNPRRKVYAVPRNQLTAPQPSVSQKITATVISDATEDEDFEPPRSKKKRVNKCMQAMQNDIESIKDSIASIKDSITEITSLSAVNSKIPLGLLQILQSSFKCHICHSIPVKPAPVILMKCCQQIVGCDTCINQWFSGPTALTKGCPLCRAQRGYSQTLLVRGLDDFLAQTATILGNGTETAATGSGPNEEED